MNESLYGDLKITTDIVRKLNDLSSIELDESDYLMFESLEDVENE